MSEVRFKVKFGKARPAPTSQRALPGFGPDPEAETHGEAVEPAPRRLVGRTARLLALAYYVERQIEAGVIADYSEAARLLGMSRARMSQVLDLLGLPPSTQEAILTGEMAVSERGLQNAGER